MILDIAMQEGFVNWLRTEKGYLIKRIEEEYEELKNTPLVLLSYSKFRRFFVDGERKIYEIDYFSNRKILTLCCLMAMLNPDNEEYLSRLQDAIWTVCDELTWVLPAHLHGDKSIEDNITRIDLFSAQTATTLVSVLKILENRLDERVKERIKYELERRIIEPFGKRSFWWETKENNWATVCGAGVGIVFMYLRPELFLNVKKKIDICMESFLRGYMSDGLCREGIDYWSFGFGNFCLYAEELRQFTNGECNYFLDEKIGKIAQYKQKMFMGRDRVVKVADSFGTDVASTWLPYFLKSVYKEDITIYKPFIEFRVDKSLFDSVVSLIYYDECMEEEYTQKDESIYFDISALYIKKTQKYSFVAKAGHNDEPHNHNDVGTFSFHNRDKEILCDIGVGYYNLRYWDDRRYGIFCTSSYSHNVPIIDGQGQKDGISYAGSMSLCDGVISIEMANAYEKGIAKSIKRNFEFKEEKIILTDIFNLEKGIDFTERFVTGLAVALEDGIVKIDNVSLLYDSEKFEVKIGEGIHKNRFGEHEKYNCIDFSPKNDGITVFEMTIEVN